jgi:molecular chaperone GrpE
MEALEFLREKKLLSEDKESFKIIHDDAGELSLVEMLNEYSELKGNDKYLRLAAEFENYKKRVQKEKEDLVLNTKVKTLSSLLDMDNDFNIATKSIKNEEALEGIRVIHSKLSSFLISQGIEEVQTESYDEDLHEVISVIPGEDNKIVDVVSKGYTLNGKPFRYPKIVLSKNA